MKTISFKSNITVTLKIDDDAELSDAIADLCLVPADGTDYDVEDWGFDLHTLEVIDSK